MKKTVLSLFVIALSLFLTACAVNNSTDNAASNDDSSNDDVLNVGLSSNAETLDPILYTGVYESQIMRSIGDTLLEYDQDLEDFVPSLATDWEVSDDNKSYTFELRDDVHFQPGEYQDGEKMDAEDVKFSLERSSEESAEDRLTGVEDVEVIDDYEVKINLEEPNSALLAMLTDSGNMIVPKEEVEGWGDEFGSHVIGTGPFILDDWKTDQQVNLTKNEDYWGEDPNLESVVFKFITDDSTMGNSLRSGDLDIATDITGENREIIEEDEDLELLTTPGLQLNYLDMNYQEGPTSDPKVREAITKATDKEAIVDGIYQFGGGVVAHGPIPDSSWGYDDSLEEVDAEYDPKEAKKILDETEYAGGFETDLYVLESRSRYAEIFQQQMKENLDIDVNIEISEWGTLTDVIASNEAPMNIGGWSWYPDPYFFLNTRFHSNQHGSNGNGKGYESDKVDELLNEAKSKTTDQDKRSELYKEAAEEIMNDYGSIEFDYEEIAFGVNSKVKGFNLNADQSLYIVSPDGTNIELED